MEHSKIVILLVLLSILLFSTCGIQSTSCKSTEPIEESRYVYDCIDFYKQPAFDNLLLANHTFHHEMRPSSMATIKRSNGKYLVVDHNEIPPNGRSCPVGTVSIRRITKDDRIREKLYVQKYESNFAQNSDTTHYALVRTKTNPTKYNGGTAEISIWNPMVQDSQYSSGQLVIRNGQDSIQVGWTEKTDGHWWLRVGQNLKPVGFWPKDLFNVDMAPSVEWGGQAYSPPNVPSPPMGAGTFLIEHMGKDAFCSRIQIVGDSNQLVDTENIEAYVTPGYHHQVKKFNAKREFGAVFLWGGPGGIKSG